LLKALEIDADRKALHAGLLLAELDHVRSPVDGAELLDERAPEVVRVEIRLHADEVVFHDGAQELAAARQGTEHFGRGPRDMVEIADAVGHAEGAQLSGEGDQVIIVNPDEVVGADQSRYGGGEAAVDAQVSGII